MNALEHALAYAARGWRIAPIKDRSKVPRLTKWQDKATTDEATIRGWYNRWPNTGLCLATGQESGVWVLDVDPASGGIAALTELTAEHGALPRGPRVNTGTLGFHLYFANPPGLHVSTTKQVGGTGLDVRGDGGQVLIPPTGHAWDQCKLCADLAKDCPGLDYRWHHGRNWESPLPDAPDWLLDLVVPARAPEPVKPEPPARLPVLPGRYAETGSAAEAIEAENDWHTLLLGDGWTLASTEANGDTSWTRPGKDAKLGISAILHEPEGPLVNYSTMATDLCQPWAKNKQGDGWSYSIFGYLAATRFGGNRSSVASDWRERQKEHLTSDWASSTGGVSTAPGAAPDSREAHGEAQDDPLEIELIDWDEIGIASDAFIHGLLFPGRWTAIAAEAKAGKTTLQIFLTTEISEGRSPFDGEPIEPVPVFYIDAEMGRLDLLERLVRMGHTDPTKLLNWYATDVPPRLDVAAGAAMLHSAVEKHGIKVVVIDGLNGVVSGAEKDDTTWREFFRLTVAPLKRLGCAVLTGDNLGKDKELGPRGSSVKMDKADAIIRLARTEEGVKLTTTHRRSGQYLPELSLKLEGYSTDQDTRRVRYLRTEMRGWTPGVIAAATMLDRVGVPLDAGRDKARKIVQGAGEQMYANELHSEVQRYREAQDRLMLEQARLDDWMHDGDGGLL